MEERYAPTGWTASAISVFTFVRPYLRYVFFAFALLVSTPLLFVEFSKDYPLANDMASVAVLMSILWIFEAIPLAVTALIPLILFPLYGIATANEVSAEYLNDSTFLFFGGFVVAKAIEKYDLHRRIALLLLSFAGNRSNLILLAFMCTTGFLSMWISNTATAALMIPILLSLLDTIRQTFILKSKAKQIAESDSEDEEQHPVLYQTSPDEGAIEEIMPVSKSPQVMKKRLSESIEEEPDRGEDDERSTEIDIVEVICTLPDTGEIDGVLDPALEKELKRYGICLVLGVAYSATLGGIATLIGTVPNLNFTRTLGILYPEAPEISFLSWMVFSLPISLMMIGFIWLFFVLFMTANAVFSKGRAEFDLPADIFKQRYIALGKVTIEQIIVLISVVIMIVLWFTRLGFGTSWFSGWSEFLPDANYGTVAILVSVALFIIPAPCTDYKKSILGWEDLVIFPWDIILLLGGGYALAFGFTTSGLSDWIATSFESFSDLNVIFVVFLVCTITTFLTELTSNTAVSSIFLPIVGTLAVTLGQNPLLLMVPCTISSSMAFMFPVATPPNAIAFTSGMLKVEDMAKPGFLFNLVAVIVMSVFIFIAGGFFFDIELGVVPSWAS